MRSSANISSVLCISLIVGATQAIGKSVSEKPNFILIVADDLGYADLGFQGSKQIPTPNIDKLAKEGIIFSNGYVSSSVCSPSRAGIMTGKNQVSFGFNDNLFPSQPGFDPNYVGLPLTETTLENKLKALGYVNGLIGKWHLGEKPQFHPLKRGFDEFWGFLGGAHDYFTAKPNGEGMDCPINCTYKTPDPLTYITDDIGHESVDAGGILMAKDNFTGVNIIPFLTGQTDKIPHQTLEWRYTVGTAIREGDWKLIHLPDRLPMLYHLSEDISEQKDVALQNLDRTKAMLKKLGNWEVHLPHPVFHEPADWRIRHLGFYDAEYQLVQPE